MKFLEYLHRHKKNDDRPYATGELMGVFAFLILGVFSLSIVDHYLLRSGSLAAVVSSVLVDLVNGDRQDNELGGLVLSPILTAAAQAKANHMAENEYFAHIDPDNPRKNSWYWFEQVGYKFTYAGENLAINFSDSTDVERAWMNSPTHRANILNGNFKEIGIATAEGLYQGRRTTFVVQMFGTPALAATPPVRVVTSPVEPTAPAIATTEPAPVATPTEVAGAAAPETGAAGDAASPTENASWWQYLLASPKTALHYAYYALTGLVLLLLAYMTELEFHRRHLRHAAAAVFLFVLMGGLALYANLIFFVPPVVAAP